MANPYTPADGSEPLSYWQQRIYDEARMREEAAQNAWSYTYIYCGTTTKQLNTIRTTGDTYSIDPELKFIPKPDTAYSFGSMLYFSDSGSTGSLASGITIGISGTSVASGASYAIHWLRVYTGGNQPTYYSGNPVTFSATSSFVSVNFIGHVESTSNILAWANKDNPPYIGVYWSAGKRAILTRGSNLTYGR